MAYLNVRERRLETRIAYVGPLNAETATNLEQLGLRASPHPAVARQTVTDDVGEVLALEWMGATHERFRDCQLFARVIAPRGALSAQRARALLRDVDGIVLVVDASPSSRDENRASAALVREALVAEARRNVAVVVQVNGADAAEALSPDVVASELDTDWPHVEATASTGRGVVETLERALADVLEAIQGDPKTSTGETVRPGAPGATRTEGNPLLTALRQVLRETVEEHVAKLEARLVAQLDAAAESAKPDLGEVSALRRALVDESARTRAAVDSVRGTVTSSVAETTRALAAHSGAIAALERKFLEENQLITKVDGVHKSVDGLQTKVAALQTRVEKVRDEVRSEIVRVVEIQARADREHLATVATNLRRLLDELVSGLEEVKTHDVREVAQASETQLGEVLQRMTELTEELKKKDKKGWFG